MRRTVLCAAVLAVLVAICSRYAQSYGSYSLHQVNGLAISSEILPSLSLKNCMNECNARQSCQALSHPGGENIANCYLSSVPLVTGTSSAVVNVYTKDSISYWFSNVMSRGSSIEPGGSTTKPSTNAVDGILTNLQEPLEGESWVMIDFGTTVLVAGVEVWNRQAANDPSIDNRFSQVEFKVTSNSTLNDSNYNLCARETGTLSAGAEKYYPCDSSNGNGGFFVDNSNEFLIPGRFVFINITTAAPFHVRELSVHGYVLSVL